MRKDLAKQRQWWRIKLITLSLFLLFSGSAFVLHIKGSTAPANQPPGPDRFSVVTVDYTKYYWWLIRWGEQDHECEIEVDHEVCQRQGIFILIAARRSTING